MFGFGGGFNGPGGGGTNSGSAPSGKSKSDGKSPSERNAEGKEGTHSGPGNPGHSPSTSGKGGTGHGPGSGAGGSPSGGGSKSSGSGGDFGSREGQRAGPGNPSAGGGMAEKGDRVGGGSYSAADVDPARFGGTPTGFAPTGRGDRVGTGAFSTGIDPNIDPTRFGGALSTPTAGRVTRGFGASIPAQTFRDAEETSMAAFQNLRSTDLAEMRRAQEDASMNTYRAEVAAVQNRNVAAHQEAATSMLSQGIGGVEGRLGITDAFMGRIVDRMIGVESNNNPTAKNPRSSATGLGQFINSTWDNMIDKYRPDLASTLTRAEQRALKTDPTLAREMTTNYATENAVHLAKNGISVTPASVYAAHFLGPDGAVKAYRANPKSSAVSVLGSSVVNANPGIMKGRTIGSVLGYVDAKMRGLDDSTEIVDRKVAPAARFASTYLGTADPHTREEAYFGDVPSAQTPQQAEENANEWAASAPTQIGPPNGDLNKYPPAPEEKKPRSIAGTLLAGGIDVLSTLAPGVGPYVGVVNAGLSLTGNRTIGEVVSDSIMNGDNAYQPGTSSPSKGGHGEYGTKLPEPKLVTKPGATAKTASFADKYLGETGFNDPTKRPTPAQKWGEGSNPSTYGGREYA